jgi:hypothetical protein
MVFIVVQFLLVAVVLLYISEFYVDQEILDLYQDTYAFNYLFEGGMLIKFVIVVTTIFLNVLLYSIHIDSHLLNRYGRIKVIGSKILVVSLLTILIVCIYVLLLYVIGIYIAMYLDAFSIISLVPFLLLGLFYTMFGMLLMMVLKNQYVLILVIVFYFLGSIFTPLSYGESFTTFELMIGFLIPDVMFYHNEFQFMYGSIYLLSVIFGYIVGIITIYNKSDIILF